MTDLKPGEQLSSKHRVDDQQQELMRLLQSEIEHMHNLMRSMDQENAALAEYHTATLEDVIWSKQEIIKQLDVIDKKREKMLERMNQGSDNFQDSFKGNKQLSLLWNELVALAKKCQKKNRINGGIVDLVTRQSQHALNILRGISLTEELYDYSGQTMQSTIEGQSLTKA